MYDINGDSKGDTKAKKIEGQGTLPEWGNKR